MNKNCAEDYYPSELDELLSDTAKTGVVRLIACTAVCSKWFSCSLALSMLFIHSLDQVLMEIAEAFAEVSS